MIKPLNQLNAFFALAEERMLKGSDQLLWLHLFNRFNKVHWQETIRVSDKALADDMRLYDSTGKPASVNTIRNAKSRLKLKGFIDFKPGKGIDLTSYTMVQLYEDDNPCDTPDHTPTLDPYDTPCDSYKVYSLSSKLEKDVKTKDVKTKDDNNTTHVRGEVEPEEVHAGGQLSLPSQKVLDIWEKCKGAKLDGNQLIDLTTLEKAYGLETVKKAMETASLKNKYDSFPKVTYTFFKMIFDEQQRGSEKNDTRRNDSKVGRVATSAMPEWESRDFDAVAFKRFLES